MPQSTIYFRDNFFSSGITEIFNGDKERIGSLDLKSAFTSSVDVLDQNGNITVKGHFPVFSFRWNISDGDGNALGSLKQRMSFFSKKYEYDAGERGIYSIKSEAFSKEYQILNSDEDVIAEFRRLSGFFESPVYQLTNQSENLFNDEVVALVMGVNMINKRNQSSANTGAH
ncbi:hypothetical protein [Evansella tamaricis]|uniref:Uncharacterized protein n=1 Tax=Evansella tamaricis TaxID=2069301 RepID=A0ABS6JE97_9BACI|nr:hypothetical protein [Evansella tamaricis]MBU9710663.1 hypothetical protein [Evansella tamaricis]